jgi:hypothetical protein
MDTHQIFLLAIFDDHDFVCNFNQITVGGGIVEKKLLMMNPLVSDTNYADEDIESRGLTTNDLFYLISVW